MSNNIKVVFIDWFNTLCSNLFFSSLEKEDKKAFEELENRLFRKNTEILNPWMRGELSYKDVAAKISDDTFPQEYVIKQFAAGCSCMKLDYEEFSGLIKKIRSTGKKVVIATDNMDLFNEYTVPALKLEELFDDIINSCDIGILKCDLDSQGKQTFYDAYLKKHNINYEECVMIDDTPKVIDVCKNSGMNVHCIKTPAEVAEVLEKYA